MSKIKKYLDGEELREKWLSGAKKISDAVGQTLGPNGRLVAIGNGFRPRLTKDGVSVAKEFQLEDPFENVAAELIKESALKTNEIAGDSTTTSTILSYEIYRRGIEVIEKGTNIVALNEGIKSTCNDIVKEIEESATPMTEDLVKNVATVSVNNDAELGSLIADAFQKVGKDGIVNVETTKGVSTTIEITEGMEFDEGWTSSYFVNNKERMEVNFEDSYVLVTDKRINMVSDIQAFLEASVRGNKPLFIICDDISGEALNTIILNILNGVLKVSVAKCPSYGQNKIDFLNDVAALTGATFVSESSGIKLQDCGENYLGLAKGVKSTKTKSYIIGGLVDKKYIEDYVSDIKAQVENTDNPSEKDKLRRRISKFSGSAATIKIGAKTDIEAREIRDRVDDAICAVKSAFEQGVVKGGGVALYEAGLRPRDLLKDDGAAIGATILCEAIKTPFKMIADSFSKDYDAFKNELDPKICDSAKSIIEALKNAVSIATSMLTASSLIVEVKVPD